MAIIANNFIIKSEVVETPLQADRNIINIIRSIEKNTTEIIETDTIQKDTNPVEIVEEKKVSEPVKNIYEKKIKPTKRLVKAQRNLNENDASNHHILVADGKEKKISKKSSYFLDMLEIEEGN